LLAKTIFPLAVLNEIEKVLNEFKKQNNLIHISEFNSRIASIVMNEPVPFIYERLGEKYHHLLIDEFQDTSVLQWMNFIPLIENALASGYFNLVVGDGKQAIYRWRSGDIGQFNALPSIIGSDQNPVLKEREKALTNHFQLVNLDRNFRSRAEIVDFNNRFFSTIAPLVLTGGKEMIYQDIEQKYNPDNTGGFISIEFLSPEGISAKDESSTFERILGIIAEAAEQNYEWKDMAILCRSNKNASRIAGFLLASGIDVVSAESLLIHHSLKVRFVIAVLRVLFEPPNDIVKEEVRLFLSEHMPEVTGSLSALFHDLPFLPLFDLCETIIRRFDLNTTVDPYLQFFLDVVLNFSAKTSHNVLDFLAFWDKNHQKFSITVPEELNAVRVLTIHKAKGLQYPLVILPYAQESRKNTKGYLWVDLDKSLIPGLDTALLKSEKEMESTVYRHLYQDEQEKSMLDLINLLYVAMTRPEEQLYILTSLPPADSDSIDSLSKFFVSFLISEGLFCKDLLVYEFGKKCDHRTVHDEIKTGAIILNEMISSDWHNRIAIRTKAPAIWDTDNPLKKSDWGNRVHEVLSWIKVAGDLPGAIEKALIRGLIESNEAELLTDKLLQVIHHPQMRI
jgi:ATP-dependent exoDNAse (exonuclease V) beta subunit